MREEPLEEGHEQRRDPSGTTPPSPTAAAGGCMQPLGILAIVVALAIAVGGGLLAGRATAPSPASSKEVVYRGPAVVTAIRDLARLESSRFHMERVIDLHDKQPSLMGLVESEDAILLVAAADVTAGVDLGKLGEDDVDIDEEASRVQIRLPPVEVLDATLDTERTYVHTRDTDLLADRKEDLETRARKEALHELEKAAVAAGVLERARANAATTIESLVSSLGYEQVEVTFREPE